MNNKQRYRTDEEIFERKAQELLSNLENPTTEKDFDEESKEIIRRIAELSATEPFDAETQYAALLEKIKNVRPNKKSLYLNSKVVSGVAAVILIFIISVIWLNFNKNKIEPKDIETTFSEVLSEDENILLTLSNGTTVDLTEKEKMSVSLEDSIFKKNLSENESSLAKAEIKFNTLEVPKTKDFKLLLSDGTVVNINSDSKIKFPDKFSDTERLIILEEGEAFFDVAKDNNKPFIVQVNDSRIQVLGTAFNVNAYPETNMKTTLVEGKVKITSAIDDTQEITLIPGQQAEINQGQIEVRNVDVSPYIAWTKGLFMFDNLDLRSIMKQLNRWYNLDVTFADSEVAAYTFTGVINKNYSKEYIFSIIEKTTQIKIEVKNDNTIFISK